MDFLSNPEESQDETAVAVGLQKLSYPFAGAGVPSLPYPRLALNGIPSTDKPIRPDQIVNTATPQPDTAPKLSLAQRISALGKDSFGGPFASQNQNVASTPK